MLVNKETIKNNESFILKWANDVEKQDGAYNPTWKNPTEADNFFVELDNQTSIINDARFIVMDSMEYDVNYLRVRTRLQYMGKISGANKGKQLTSDYRTDITETTPEFNKDSLVAVPFSAFTSTPKTFLLQNIEKEDFLNHMESLLAESAGFSAEVIGLYGIKKATGATQDGIDHLDGFFKQADDIHTAYEEASAQAGFDKQTPMGYYTDIVVDENKLFEENIGLISQMQAMLTQFSIQRGNRSKAVFYVSNLIYGLLTQEAGRRETQMGDALFFNGDELRLWNTPIRVAQVLDVPENNYGEQILLANPESLVFGFLDEITSENSYEHSEKSYLSSVDVFFDVLILWNRDILVAKVTFNSNSGDDSP